MGWKKSKEDKKKSLLTGHAGMGQSAVYGDDELIKATTTPEYEAMWDELVKDAHLSPSGSDPLSGSSGVYRRTEPSPPTPDEFDERLQKLTEAAQNVHDEQLLKSILKEIDLCIHHTSDTHIRSGMQEIRNRVESRFSRP